MMNEQIIENLKEIGEAQMAFQARMNKRFESLETALAVSQFPGGGGSSANGNGIQSATHHEHKEKFLSWARNGSGPEGLRGLEIQAGLSTLSDPDGGFLVPDEMEKNIERLSLASVAMRRVARVVRSKGEYKKPLSRGGATGGWVAEKAARPETSTPELSLFQPPMNEVYAMPSVTQKLLDMSDFDVESWLLEEINDVFVSKEGTAFISGNGVGQPKGIIDAALMIANASWTYGKTGFIASGHASLLNNCEKLIDLQHALKPVYRQNSTWLMNDTTLSVIRKFKDGDGNFLWTPGLMANAPDMLLGRPIEIDDNMDDIGSGKFPIAYGDFKRAYTIIDHRSGIRLLRDNLTVKGSVNFYCTKRLAAGVSNYEAVKFLKIAA